MNNYQKSKYTEKEIRADIVSGKIKYVTVLIPTIYNVYSRRFSSTHFLENILPKGFSFTEVMILFNIDNNLINTREINMNTIGDNHFIIDKNTFRCLSWLGSEHIICMTEGYSGDDMILEYPRNALKIQIDKIMKKHDINFMGASEIEYYLLKDKNEDITKDYPKIDLDDNLVTQRKSIYGLNTFLDRYEDINNKIRENIINCGIELEGLFTEHGPGQYEINIKYSDILNNCDNRILLK